MKVLSSYKEGPFDLKVLKSLVFTPGFVKNSDDVRKLNDIYLSLMNARSADHVVTYDTPKAGTGNLVAKTPSIQNLSKKYRPMITIGLTDLDVVGSGISIMVQVFESHGLKCPETKRYIANRERYLRWVDRNDRDKAKKYIETVFNGGGRVYYREYNNGRNSIREKADDRLVPLFDEFDLLRARFFQCYSALPQYKEVMDAMKNRDMTGKTPASTFMATVKDYLQAKCLDAMVDFVGVANVSTLINDGILIRAEADL